MKITFTAFDGKQFDTMDECMEYEDGIREAEETKEVEVMAYIDGMDILTFSKYGEESLQWEDCCMEIPSILYFKDSDILQKYKARSPMPVIKELGDLCVFSNYWCYHEEDERYYPYEEYIDLLCDVERQAREEREHLEIGYKEMRQM